MVDVCGQPNFAVATGSSNFFRWKEKVIVSLSQLSPQPNDLTPVFNPSRLYAALFSEYGIARLPRCITAVAMLCRKDFVYTVLVSVWHVFWFVQRRQPADVLRSGCNGVYDVYVLVTVRVFFRSKRKTRRDLTNVYVRAQETQKLDWRCLFLLLVASTAVDNRRGSRIQEAYGSLRDAVRPCQAGGQSG